MSTSAHDITERRRREAKARADHEGLLWRGRIEAALANGGLVFWAQPVVDAASGEVHHHELLLRMELDGDVITPNHFLPHAEQGNLITRIDRWAVAAGIEFARTRAVAINLSARSLGDPTLLADIKRALGDRNLARNVIFEITETAAAENLRAARGLVEALTALGCGVALDDFGTGYGSFKYLKHLPVTELKIDIEFVRGLVGDPADRRVVSSIIAAAKNFGMQTVAEGVEDEATLRVLRTLGVDFVQGYHLGRPAQMTAGRELPSPVVAGGNGTPPPAAAAVGARHTPPLAGRVSRRTGSGNRGYRARPAREPRGPAPAGLPPAVQRPGRVLLGDGMINVALAFAALELSGSASAVGLVLACRALPLVACLLVGGVIADRTSHRAVMVCADLVRLASQGTMAALLIADAAELWSIALLAGVTGAATGFFNPASTGLLPIVVAPEHLQPANGLRATAMASGEILGPMIAGILVATSGPGWALGIDALTFGVSAAFLVRLRLPARAVREAGTFLDDLRTGWRVFRSRTWVWAFVASAAIGNMLWGAWSALGPVIAERDLGGAAVWGAVLAAMGGGGVAGGLLAIRARPRRPMVVAVLGGTIFSFALALLAAGVPAPVLAAGALVSGAALMFGNSVWEATLQQRVPAEALARVSAYDWFGSLAFYPLGLAIWGPVATVIGTETALWLAFGLLVVTMLAPLAVPDIRRLRGTSSPSSA